ncbi:MAG: hypothetical protein V1772_04600, partial [Chloroflexota bacterium]
MFAPLGHPIVNEIWELALPSGTTLAGGEAGLQAHVEWAVSLRVAYPVLADMRASYLALASLDILRRLEPRISLSYLISELARVSAAALVLDGPVSGEEAALADRVGLPVLVVPAGEELREVERDVVRALVDLEGQIARREALVRQTLQKVYATGGLKAVLAQVAHLVAGDVTLYDTVGVRVSDAQRATDAQRADGAQHSEGQSSPDVVVRSYPVTMRGRDLGKLVFRVSRARDNPLTAIHARQAAELCGVELLQEATRRETEERLGADLVEQLLDERRDPDDLRARLLRLGYDPAPERHHLAVAFVADARCADQTCCDHAASDLRWAAERDGASALVVRYRETVLALVSYPSGGSDGRVRRWLREALAHVGAPDGAPLGVANCYAGVSRGGAGLEVLRQGVLQALDAAHLGRRMVARRGPYYYEELGLYRLLVSLRDRAELRRFYEETLGLLVRYDAQHNTDLVATLEAFFERNANASET